MAIPMSAALTAGTSLTLSPVIGTILRSAWRASAIWSLFSGETRVNACGLHGFRELLGSHLVELGFSQNQRV